MAYADRDFHPVDKLPLWAHDTGNHAFQFCKRLMGLGEFLQYRLGLNILLQRQGFYWTHSWKPIFCKCVSTLALRLATLLVSIGNGAS